MNEWLEGTPARTVLFGASILQFLLREEKKPRYNLGALLLSLIIMVFIVGGLIWITKKLICIYQPLDVTFGQK